MVNIHILWATIRPYVFANSLKIWQERSNGVKTTTHVCINDFFTTEEKEIVKKAVGDGEVLEINQTRFGVCQKAYELSSKLEANDDDIVVFASDDFLPPDNWCNYLINKFSNKEGCLMVRDGYQLPDSSNMEMPVVTIPIMTFGALKKLNKVIYHPAYYHMYSDAELFLNAKELGILIDTRMTDATEFTHHHYAAGKRNADINDQKYHEKWNDDKATWNKRKSMSIKERLEV